MMKLTNLKSNFILLSISTVFALFLGEVMVRLFVVQETKRLATYDHELGWRGKPFGEGVYIRTKDTIASSYRYNNLGFRDDDVEASNAGGLRIALLGDSFLESLEMDYNRIFHEQFEKALQQKDDPDARVIALGSQGYSTAQELLAFRKYKDLVDPQFVWLLFYTGNDYTDNLRKSFAYLDKEGELVFPENNTGWMKVQYLTFKRWLYEHSHAVFFLKNLVESKMNVKITTSDKAESGGSSDYKYDITRKLILQLNEEVATSGAQFGVVVIPFREDLLKKDGKNVDFIMNICERETIACLDLSQSLQASDYFKHDVHFVERGHDIVAEKLYEFYSTMK
ncbi:MAG: SGNH/GDSL hydrolase family protein [Cytophagales bacterium]|nr:SGNH/GDSL hydrolase family protein [Cytophagales bacterium]